MNNNHVNLWLQPFKGHDFERLISWISGSKALRQFAGPVFLFPLTVDQLRLFSELPVNRKLIKIC